MKLIAGLGNIGEKYLFTRHNTGFMLADSIVMQYNKTFRESSKLKSFICKTKIANEDTIIIKPTTYMNLSGEAVRLVADYYKISTDDILIIFDDLSLDLGRIRFKSSGSDGGHNGIKSVLQHLGTNKIARLKIGIGPQPPIPSEVFVLQNFSEEQLTLLKDVITKAKEATEYYIQNGIYKTQNKYN